MPFAVLGAFLARPADGTWGRFAGQLGLVVACMVLARSWAMMVNRLADRGYDAANPRTAGRAVASGRLPLTSARMIAGSCAVLFVGAAGLFWVFYDNAWPIALSVPVLAWLALYSYAKRFSALCHVLLGTALAISPLAAAIAVDPAALSRVPALYAISAMVTCWVAGFDVIYALQDEAFDRATGLHSIPAKLGKANAVIVSRVLHLLAACSLFAAWRLDARFGVLFVCACVLASSLLVGEHVVLKRRGLAGLPMVFFTINGVVSCVVGGLGVVDLLVNR